MTQCKEYNVRGYDFVRLIGNADWTGTVVIQWKPSDGLARDATMPGIVLKAILKVEGRTLFEEGLNRFLDRLEEPVS